ncbi:hypothetical protein BDZ97DRAFT_1922925 [Flammula alnicola]|nr:hypothetical protein BDZ97DRAFT_1922925 [Flammula alnicola]
MISTGENGDHPHLTPPARAWLNIEPNTHGIASTPRPGATVALDIRPPITRARQVEEVADAPSFVAATLNFIVLGLCWAFTFGINGQLYAQHRYKEREQVHGQVNLTGDLALSGWTATIKSLIVKNKYRFWTCGGIAAASCAALSIPDLNTNIPGRTFAIATGICSAAGCLLGWMYLSSKSELEDPSIQEIWKEASDNLNEPVALEFWTCLAAPHALQHWSILFAGVTISVYIWIKSGGEALANQGLYVASGAFLTTLLAVAVLVVWRTYILISL